MKKTLHFFLFFVLILFASHSAQAQQLAFPGAEGFGRYALGARGVANPSIYHVTNLNDSGAGSLRDAISQPGRVVVFDVSGVIKLKSRLVFSANSYIAGQTAPGDGIIIYGNGVSFSGANNIIVRYLRIYMGKGGDSGKDAAGIANGSNMIFDHCSFLWGLDENFSINWDNKGTKPSNITLQNCIIGQGIQSHSCGGLIQTDGGVSIIGCLYIDNKTRNPKVKGLNQFINNVVYNWGSGGGYIMGDTSGDSWAWIEGNYFISGPANTGSAFTRATSTFQLYANDNIIDNNRDGVLNGSAASASDYGSPTIVTDRSQFTKITQVHPEIAGGILSSREAYNKVIAQCGAYLPARTAVEEFLIEELQTLGVKGVLIKTEAENGIYENVGVVCSGPGISSPSLNTGMGDNGYLNAENYINSISGPVAPYVRCASNIKMTDRTVTSIQLSWKNRATDSDQILLQQSSDGKSFTTVATLPANATTHNVTGLSEETIYYYRLITKKSGLSDSTPSEIYSVSTKGEPRIPYVSTDPEPGIDATSRFYTEIPFSWKNTTGPWAGDVTFEVFLGNSPDNLVSIGSNLKEQKFVFENAGLTIGNTYYWRVDTKNPLGTTSGAVWSFKAGSYSFVASSADIGVDFFGEEGKGTTSTAKSGTTITTSKTYTINSGKVNELKITASGSDIMNTGTKNGVYLSSGNFPFFYLKGDDYYIQGDLTTNSKDQNISAMQINGTSADLADGSAFSILFSDKATFSLSSVIGYDEVETPPCRLGEPNMEIKVPVGAKSFRICKKVTFTPVSESTSITLTGKQSPRIAYIAVGLELVSNDGNPVESSDNTISSATINGKSATIVQTTGSITYKFPMGTILGEWPVLFTLGSDKAKTNFTSGNTHNFANGPLSIEVEAENGDKKVYTVTAEVSTKKLIGMLTTDGKAAVYDNIFLSAFEDYDIEYLMAEATAPSNINTFYDKYDLIVLHSNVGGENATGVATAAMVGVKPVLNMKAYFYTTGGKRWGWGTPGNPTDKLTSVKVPVALQNHQIFSNVTFNGENLTLYSETPNAVNAIQYSGTLSGLSSTLSSGNHVIATIDGDQTKINIHEINVKNDAKYLLFAWSMEGTPSSYTLFHANAVTMLKNAADYLTNSYTYYDYATNTPTGIKGISLSNIKYFNGNVYNPNEEYVKIFNSMGVLIMSSDESLINVQGIPSGLYIIKTKEETVKFVK